MFESLRFWIIRRKKLTFQSTISCDKNILLFENIINLVDSNL